MITAVSMSARLLHRALRYRYKLNRPQIAAMLALLPRGGIAFDIGAHKGGYSFWMARAVGRQGRVLSFEPQGRLAHRTARSLQAAHLAQVRFFHAAVTDRCGRGVLTMRAASTHGASIEGLDESRGELEREEVELITIDAAAEREGIDRADFIKIDVEGHELAVLRGGMRTIAAFRPVILAELEARHHESRSDGNAVQAAGALLEPLGYRGYFFVRGRIRPVREFRPEIHQVYGRGEYCNDFLFVPEVRRGVAADEWSRRLARARIPQR